MKPGSSQFSSRWMSPYLKQSSSLDSECQYNSRSMKINPSDAFNLKTDRRTDSDDSDLWSYFTRSGQCAAVGSWCDPGVWWRERSSSVERVNSEWLIYKLGVVGRQANKWELSERTGPLHDRTLQRQQNNNSSVLNTTHFMDPPFHLTRSNLCSAMKCANFMISTISVGVALLPSVECLWKFLIIASVVRSQHAFRRQSATRRRCSCGSFRMSVMRVKHPSDIKLNI